MRDEEPRPAGPVAEGSPPAHPREGQPSTPPTGEEQVQHDLDALLAEAEQQRDEYLDLAKRTKADFENYRKRMAAEVQVATVRGKAELAGGLIKVIDTLELALDAAGIDLAGDKAPDEGLAQGILLTYRQLCETLAQAGVESYNPAGEKFDPAWHEALQKMQVEGTEPGTVVEVIQKGYRLDGQVLRAARVVVSE
jgi:molecular chaperone GrpE